MYFCRHTVHFALLFSFMALFGCRREVIQPDSDRGKAYYPYSSGLWWEFEVDSTFYNDFSGDTIQVSYILREEFTTPFSAENGQQAIRVEQFRKYPGSQSWVGPRVYWTYLTEQGAVKVEENIPYVKINYPVRQDLSWNGNRYNFQPQQIYLFSSVDAPLVINGIPFDSTATVLQKSFESLLGKEFYQEKYARNVGLIEKEIIDIKGFIDSDNIPDTLNLPLMQRIRSGIIYRQKISDWGTF